MSSDPLFFPRILDKDFRSRIWRLDSERKIEWFLEEKLPKADFDSEENSCLLFL